MKRFLFMKIRISAGTVRGILLTAAVLICMGCCSVKTWAQQEQLSGKMEDVKASEDIKEPGNAKEPEDAQAYSTKSAQEGWICRNQKYLYYEGGRKVKGIKTINGKKYYFDSKGVQHTGWQKYEDQYYFFKTANAGKGFMIVSDKINDITLASDGKAKLTDESRAKLEILAMANQIVEKASKPAMTKQEKLRKSFDYLLKHYQTLGTGLCPGDVLGETWQLLCLWSSFCISGQCSRVQKLLCGIQRRTWLGRSRRKSIRSFLAADRQKPQLFWSQFQSERRGRQTELQKGPQICGENIDAIESCKSA